MNKTVIKRALATSLAAALLTATPALAEYDPNKVYDPTVAQTRGAIAQYSLNINGAYIENPGIFLSGETVMIPLRAVAETLGFTVNWDGDARRIEMTKIPVYISLSPDADGYTFSKTAPLQLGTAPQIVDGSTYVPLSFITEVLKGEATIENGTDIVVTYGEAAENGTAVSVIEKHESGLLVEDPNLGEVVVHVADTTTIQDEAGNALTFAELDSTHALTIVYDAAMAMSLPPQVTAVSITQMNALSPVVLKNTVAAVETEEVPVYDESGKETGEKRVFNRVVLGDAADVLSQTILNISEDTVFVGEDGEEIALGDLVAGDEIKAIVSPAMTMSLPPQVAAYKIQITKAATLAEPENVTVTDVVAAVDAENQQVILGSKDDPNAQTILNLGPDTVIVNAQGEAADLSALTEGTTVTATVAPAMTLSLPPQVAVYEIQIVE